MTINFSQLFRQSLRHCILVLAIGCASVSIASGNGNTPTDLVISNHKGSELQLEVRQMPLAKVLETITSKTHIPIHYSVLPEGLVTATCVGSTLERILECLLDRKADLIVRYPHNLVKGGGKGQVVEAWIMGSQLDNGSASANCIARSGDAANDGSVSLRQNEQDTATETDHTDELLKTAQSNDPIERADAIGALLADGREGDPNVKAVLEQALTDQDANVRAQAVSSLSHREGSGAVGAIQQALHDSSADVRMMAVDGIVDDISLLQQAVNDSDESIRSLATIKLEQLTQNASVKQ
jgi:hypothetical protein